MTVIAGHFGQASVPTALPLVLALAGLPRGHVWSQKGSLWLSRFGEQAWIFASGFRGR